MPLVVAALMLALFLGLCPRPELDVDRLPDTDREAVSQTTARPTTNSTVPGAASDSLLCTPMNSPTQLLDPATPWKNSKMPPTMQASPNTSPESE